MRTGLSLSSYYFSIANIRLYTRSIEYNQHQSIFIQLYTTFAPINLIRIHVVTNNLYQFNMEKRGDAY